ncbi:glycogen debranching protein GlgX [Methylobacterium sp. C25]|uniref:glycogen debranching protein GlgX n=1 Tax=Methylobacterium sp. C25 TaxID=2721622 RepID=UPI001F460A40|nr:glycogen debranching protein GlgX [Methylobacterium sp. C25]MCE4223751.1 glycogen debranching protein GlgX [Methylobacterium sp. C25]
MIVIEEGVPAPLGAHFDGRGVNFALFSQNATAVDLCLFDPGERHERHVIRLPCRTDDVFHGYLHGVLPGQQYGYRVHGPWEPSHGHRFNPAKLVIDPYAREIAGRIRWNDSVYGFRRGLQRDDAIDRRDSAPSMPRGVIARTDTPDFTPSQNARPLSETVIYEAHVKALTMTHPALSASERGTYLGLAHPAIIDHLIKLGVTALELLPIQAFVDDRFLVEKGLVNFWGYQPYNYFAPEPRYLGDGGTGGLRFAIRELAAAGIETIIDVVYNHTAEGGPTGPTLSFRGIDNYSYYKLKPENLREDVDCTGCGNTLDVANPRVMQMVLDSLRYWVQSYGVAGFRFDLATSLGRSPYDFWHRAAFFQAIRQDPVLARVKLIAEPWDVGHGGYRLGGYPYGWSEWNDQFRDNLRGFWRGDDGLLGKLTQGLSGSREIFNPSGRAPQASINYAASHDGYTLADVVAYEQKHNHANGEENRDGHGHNLSRNYGVEGATDEPAILSLRARQTRNMLATVFLAQGVPMLLMGDERGRTQQGNNNAYCQDNAVSWMDWAHDPDPDLASFVGNLSALRRRCPSLRRRHFLNGTHVDGTELRDVHWLSPDGTEMDGAAWDDAGRKDFGMQIGNDIEGAQRVLVLMNAAESPCEFRLARAIGGPWRRVFDTTLAVGTVPPNTIPLVEEGGSVPVAPRSVLVLKAPPVPTADACGGTA